MYLFIVRNKRDFTRIFTSLGREVIPNRSTGWVIEGAPRQSGWTIIRNKDLPVIYEKSPLVINFSNIK